MPLGDLLHPASRGSSRPDLAPPDLAPPDLAPRSNSGTVGVVVPCHNYGRFLREAIESLMGQTVVPDEIVIVNDGSTDDSAAVIAELVAKYPLIQVVTNRSPAGAPAAFRSGIRAISTTYAMVLSADDRVSNTYLEASSRVLDMGFDVARSAAVLFGARDGEWPVASWSLTDLLFENAHHGSMMFRRSVYDRVGGYRNMAFEDWDLWLRMAASGAKAGEVSGCALEYRQHGPSRNAKSVWSARRGRFALLLCNVRVLGFRTSVSVIFRRLL